MPEPLVKPVLVCDTSVLLYLGRIAQVELLPALFAPIYVPEAVELELEMGRLLRSDTLDLQAHPWANVVAVPAAALDTLPANRLGHGERAVIAYARVQRVAVAGLDDRQARELAESLGLRVTGILGILLRAHRAGLVAQIQPLLDALIHWGFRLSPALYADALALAAEK